MPFLGDSFESLVEWNEIVSFIRLKNGRGYLVRVELENPVEGNAPIEFQTTEPVDGDPKRLEWAKKQALREAYRLLDCARGLMVDPNFISYLPGMSNRKAGAHKIFSWACSTRKLHWRLP